MYSLFKSKPIPSQGILKYPGWSYPRDGIKRNLGQLISFYRRNPMAVPSEHLLVRLVQSIPVPLRIPAERFYDHIDAAAMKMASAFNLVSPINKGEVKDGVFYGPGVPEVIIADDSPIDPNVCTRNWKNLQPVRVLAHPRSDLRYNLPDGTRQSTESRLSVIYIHVPMLCLQYRAFRIIEESITGQEESQLSVMQFIHMYVLPNMMPDHIDIAIFNRFDNYFRQIPNGHVGKESSLYLPNYDLAVDEAHAQILTYLEQAPRNFAGILQTIPTVTHDSAYEALQLPKVMSTRQTEWAMCVARLRAVSFLADFSRQYKNMTNGVDLRTIVREAGILKNTGVLKTVLPKVVLNEVQDGINSLLDL